MQIISVSANLEVTIGACSQTSIRLIVFSKNNRIYNRWEDSKGLLKQAQAKEKSFIKRSHIQHLFDARINRASVLPGHSES